MAELAATAIVFSERARDLARIAAVEMSFLAQVDVRCGREEAARLGFPLEPNTVAGDAARSVLWLGPDEWLDVTESRTARASMAELEESLRGTHHSVVDVSGSRAVIELRGTDRLELLATGCSLDLDPRGGWVPGRCAQSLFGRSQVLLQELGTLDFERATALTGLEDEILRLTVEGSTSNEVAQRLSLPRRSVAEHLQNALRKHRQRDQMPTDGATRIFVRSSFAHATLDRLVAAAAVLRA